MSFVPNTVVEFFKEIPLNANYEDTFYFSNTSSQTAWFDSYGYVSLVNNQYRVEPDKSAIKVEIPYSRAFPFNYMRFKNSSYENKWFYAFVTKVEYVNEETSRITYEIDVMQTFLVGIDYTLGQCFVEREHTASDALGFNIVPEDFKSDDLYVYAQETYDGCNFTYQHVYVLAIIDKDDIGEVSIDGLPPCTKLFGYTEDEEDELRAKILEYSEAPEKICGVYVVPSEFVTIRSTTHEIFNQNMTKTKIVAPVLNQFSGYTPRNKKLLTYPFTFLRVSSPNGSADYRYEFFKTDMDDTSPTSPTFEIACSINQPVSMTLRPTNYRQYVSANIMNASLGCGPFPVCAWNTDSYREYMATQYQTDTNGVIASLIGAAVVAIGVMGAAFTGGTSAAAGATFGSAIAAGGSSAIGAGIALSAAGSVINSTATAISHENIASVKDTNANYNKAGSSDYGSGKMKFYFQQVGYHKELIERIDDFFQMYGYKQNRIKTPYVHCRQKWTYTKTVGCNIENAKMPSEMMMKITSIFDNGIRFWADKTNVGYYWQDNPIIDG